MASPSTASTSTGISQTFEDVPVPEASTNESAFEAGPSALAVVQAEDEDSPGHGGDGVLPQIVVNGAFNDSVTTFKTAQTSFTTREGDDEIERDDASILTSRSEPLATSPDSTQSPQQRPPLYLSSKNAWSKLSLTSRTTTSTYMSGVGSGLAYGIGWTGDVVLNIAAEVVIRRWLTEHERREEEREPVPGYSEWFADDEAEGGFLDIFERVEDLLRRHDGILVSRHGYPRRIRRRALRLLNGIYGDRIWRENLELRYARLAVIVYWDYASVDNDVAVAILNNALDCLRYSVYRERSLEEKYMQRRDDVAMMLLPVICHLLGTFAGANFASSQYVIFYRLFKRLLFTCGEDILHEIVRRNAADPFLVKFIAGVGVLAREKSAFVLQGHEWDLRRILAFLAPLASLDTQVYRACKQYLQPHISCPEFEDVENNMGTFLSRREYFVELEETRLRVGELTEGRSAGDAGQISVVVSSANPSVNLNPLSV